MLAYIAQRSFFCVIALAPLTLLQPILVGIPGTWEERNLQTFKAAFVVEALVLSAAGVLSRVASYYSVQWQKSSEQNLADLDIQVRQMRVVSSYIATPHFPAGQPCSKPARDCNASSHRAEFTCRHSA